LAKNVAPQNTLLRPEKTFLFGQGLLFVVGTRFLAKNVAPQNFLQGGKKHL